MKNLVKVLFVAALVSSSVLLLQHESLAVFTLSLKPYEGGFDLRFGKINFAKSPVNKELSVSISNDQAKQYRLVQFMSEPLRNEQGASMPADSFRFYSLSGSNKLGSLQSTFPTQLSSGRQPIYTSNQNGSSDSFIVVYSIANTGRIPSGSYRGRIGFTLEPIGGGLSPVTAWVNVILEVEGESRIEIRTAAGSKTLHMRTGDNKDSTGVVQVNISAGQSRNFRIIQMVNENPASGAFLKAVKFRVKEAKKGNAITEPTVLSNNQQVIYTSSNALEGDSFYIEYWVDDSVSLKAGTYRTDIRYLLQPLDDPRTSNIDAIHMEIDVVRSFDLKVSSDGGGLIRFSELKPGEEPKVSEVIIEVATNVGKRYQITQKVIAPLKNQKGDQLPEANFTMVTESLETRGNLLFPNITPVKTGDSVIFVSDQQGSPDKIKLLYRLQLPMDFRSGEYTTRIIYSLSEL